MAVRLRTDNEMRTGFFSGRPMTRGTLSIGLAAIAAAALVASGCTVHNQETPSLTGPSELGTSIGVSVSPDVLAQDGASQSVVTITARDANGQPLRSLSLRVEIAINGLSADFGSLSARNVVTDANGRATLVYTAPPAPAFAVDTGTVVSIRVTPIDGNFANSTPRSASIRLVPPNIVVPPDDLTPTFTISPSVAPEGSEILFDASASSSTSQNFIASYTWDFGDGRSGSGKTESHVYSVAGNYTVVLSIKDSVGRTGSTAKQVTITAATLPTASFNFSPSPAQLNQPIHFNATASSAPAGRRIVSYNWVWGDGSQSSTPSPLIDKAYVLPRTYIVTLTVIDDLGKTSATVSQIITPQ
jgi:hypothetical protein